MARSAQPEGRRSHTVAELRHQRAAADRKATKVYAMLAVLAAGLSAVWSLLFPMAGAACRSDGCHADLVLGLAYLITWGGIVGGVTLAVMGCSARRRPPTRYWSMAGLALIVATCLGGVLTANSIIGG